ncbi:MAG TPA: hypothetical protein VGP53_02105 [Acidimicrobiales bacterium]|nr:hypothetical protein [Acidimicrobiales bacterium]
MKERPLQQRIAARLLLACCTLALGLGLGTATAVVGVIHLQHPRVKLLSPSVKEAQLDRGLHELFVVRNAPGGLPPVSESRPVCTVTDTRSGQEAPTAISDGGFAALRVLRNGRHRVACTSAFPVTVDVAHQGEPFTSYLAAVGRGLVPAVTLTVLAAVLAARALLAARRLRSEAGR